MIRTITMRGLGPHDDTTLALATTVNDWTDIKGRSKDGKSSTMLAATFALWGEEPDGTRLGLDAIRDGADRAEVVVELLNGLRVGRSITQARSVRRSIERNSTPEQFPKSDRAMLDLLGPLGQDHDLARLVMMPGEWRTLALGEGGGRPLRDALARILPAAPIPETVARLMLAAGHTLLDDDPTDEPGALKLRADANRAEARRRGEVEALEASVVRAKERAQQSRGPSAEDVAVARATIALSDEWGRYERHGAAVGAYEREVQQAAAWRTRRDALGARPDDNGAEITKATDWRNLARATAADKRRDLDRAGRALEDARQTERDIRATAGKPHPLVTEAERATLEAARKAAEFAREQFDGARKDDPATFPEVVAALADLNGAAHALDRATAAAAEPSPTGPCSHCGSSEWPNAETRAAHLADDLDAATRDHAEAEAEHAAALRGAQARQAEYVAGCEEDFQRFAAEAVAAREALLDAERDADTAAEQARDAAIEAAAIAVEQARAGIQRAEEAECEAGVVLEQAEAARDAAVKAGTAAREWDAAAAAIGEAPTVRPAPSSAPTPPQGAKPPAAALEQARATLDAAEQARGAAATRSENVGELEADVESARTRAEASAAEAARAGALLACVRAAPSEAVRESIEGLDAGPVSLHLEGSGVKVQIAGRRWQRASDGEFVLADLQFRAALRAALTLGGRHARYLPLFVDRAQDVAGLEWPDVPGPVVRLWSTEGDIEVTRHAGRPA